MTGAGARPLASGAPARFLRAMHSHQPRPGAVTLLEPGIRRILAPNPSPMTCWGTNTHLLGEGRVTVLDPGPADPGHMRAILAGLAPGERVAQILVSHAHLDHSPLARPLAEATGAPVLAFGPPEAGRSEVMDELAAQGLAGGGEGVDHGFAPDDRIGEGDTLRLGGGGALAVLHTPGHMAGHLSFALGDAVLSGDHVIGWASTLISPPDGDLTAFLASCARLARQAWRVFYPAHGAPVADPAARLGWLVAHRAEREAQILAALDGAPLTIAELAARIYTDTPPALLRAGERNVFAHLIDLAGRGLVRPTPGLSPAARYERI